MSTHSLSFIIPVYEPDPILFDKVLKALCTQSLKEFETVFVMDGHFPEAEKAIQRVYSKHRKSFKMIIQDNAGAQRARNVGFKESSGKYVVFFDSDCVIEPHTAKAWVELLDKNLEYGFIYSGYQFEKEQGAINSQPFDPWTLRVTNYISACFPVRRELVGTWNEDLKSLQDWDFWLGVVERGGKGMFLQGYAFSTAYPTPKSISGQGCTKENWLDRMDKVKALHNIPIRKVCVTSVNESMDGIALAKAIDADYHDYPNDKPNHYETIIQIGFSVRPGEFERCASVWGKQHKKVIFWTSDDVEMIYCGLSKETIDEYAPRINILGKQFVEDKRAYEIMRACGFEVEVLPLPVISTEKVDPLPEKPKFLVDYAPAYAHVLNAIQRAIPDIELAPIGGVQEMSKYTGLVHFKKHRLLSPSIKRMLAAGRHVLSNVQQPFTGYISDHSSNAHFMREFVDKIRKAVKRPQSMEQVRYWIDPDRITKVKEAIL